MTDGISVAAICLLAVLAISGASVAVRRLRELEKRLRTEQEDVTLRHARLRAERQLLEIQVGELRGQVTDLEQRRTYLLAEVEAARAWRDPAATAPGSVRVTGYAPPAPVEVPEGPGLAKVIPLPLAMDRSGG